MSNSIKMFIDENAKPIPSWMDWDDHISWDKWADAGFPDNYMNELTYENMGYDKNNQFSILPGVGQRIIDLLNNGARRKLEKGATLYALQILSCLMPKTIKGYDGALSTLITFNVAPTASGKEFPQKIMRELCINADKSISSKPTSEKSILETAFLTKGHLIYTNDEAHTFISSMGDNKAADYAKGIESTLLSLGASSDLVITATLQKELRSKTLEEMAKVRKRIDELSSAAPVGIDGKILSQLELNKARIKVSERLTILENDHKTINSGMLRNVRMNLALATTPIAARKAVKSDMLEKGLWGRIIFSLCDGERSEKNKNRMSDDEIEGEIYSLNRFFEKMREKSGIIKATYEAQLLLNSIDDKLETSEFRNHPTLGALYARAYELITKLASLIAWCNDDMTITKTQAQKAIDIVNTSIIEIEKFVIGNEVMTDSTSAKHDFKIKILNYLYNKHHKNSAPVYKSTIEKEVIRRNQTNKDINERWKNNSKTLFEQVIESCVKEGLIIANGKSLIISQDGFNEIHQHQ
ncbi:hypothetical protein P1O43_001733 [Salmonella enterica]|nr:hypothetical protein [Salmonella enterica]